MQMNNSASFNASVFLGGVFLFTSIICGSESFDNDSSQLPSTTESDKSHSPSDRNRKQRNQLSATSDEIDKVLISSKLLLDNAEKDRTRNKALTTNDMEFSDSNPMNINSNTIIVQNCAHCAQLTQNMKELTNLLQSSKSDLSNSLNDLKNLGAELKNSQSEAESVENELNAVVEGLEEERDLLKQNIASLKEGLEKHTKASSSSDTELENKLKLMEFNLKKEKDEQAVRDVMTNNKILELENSLKTSKAEAGSLKKQLDKSSNSKQDSANKFLAMELERELKESLANNEKLEKEIKALKEQNVKTKSAGPDPRVAELEKQLEESQNDFESNVNELNEVVVGLELERDDLKSRIESLKTIANANADESKALANCNEVVASLKKELETKTKEHEKLQRKLSEIEILKDTMSGLKKELKDSEEGKKYLEKSVSSCQCKELKVKLELVTKEKKEVETDRDTIRKESLVVIEKLSRTNIEFVKLKSEFDEEHETVETQQHQIDELEEVVEGLETERNDGLSVIAQLKKDLAKK